MSTTILIKTVINREKAVNAPRLRFVPFLIKPPGVVSMGSAGLRTGD
jgi:hypothetical protein